MAAAGEAGLRDPEQAHSNAGLVDAARAETASAQAAAAEQS